MGIDNLLKILEDEIGEQPAIVKRKSDYSIIRISDEDYILYETNYKFKAHNETNIPSSITGNIPLNINKICFVFRGKPYLLNVKDINPNNVRYNSRLSQPIFPIKIQDLKPFPKKQKYPFTHLHLHSDSSLLDGITSCKKYLAKAKEYNMTAMAVTDHGNVSAHMDFQVNAKGFDIKPIFGVESYITKDAKLQDSDHRTSNHIVLLAKDEVGYKNMLTLQKLAWSPEHYYYRPRIDYKMLKTHHKGLVVLTACLKGLIAKEVLLDRNERAIKRLLWLQKLFGNDLYLELQLHKILDDKGIDIQAVYNKQLIEFSKQLGIKTVITNDVHYLEKGMHEVQSKVIKMKSDSDLAEAYCDSIWFKDLTDLEETRHKDCPYIDKKIFYDSINATKEIVEKCNYVIPTGGLKIPTIDISEFPKFKKGMTEEEYLRKRISTGLKLKIVNGKLSDKLKVYLKRIEREIDAFKKMGVISYILIYDDLIRFLKKKGCLCSLRGSANGSVVLWLIGISVVDPIKFNILFERFISPARIEAHMADIDIDLDVAHTYRDTAIKYLKERYGEENICIVGSFNRTQLKAAIKGLARAEALELKKQIENTDDEDEKLELQKKLDQFSFQEMNRITKLMPNDIEDIQGSPVEDWFKKNEDWIDKYVRPIIGNAYAESMHPAGIVISPEPCHNWLPLRTNKISQEKGGHRVYCTQWENSHTGVESLNECGVMIMDILGVKNLTIINDTLKLIKKRHDIRLKFEDIPLDDKTVYKTLSNGENLGFFQLGKESLKGLFRKIKPDNIEDIIFLIAADRPGPMAAGAFEKYSARKHGKEKPDYYHPSLKPVLNNSLGVLVYSEHIMLGSQVVAGFTPLQAEKMRKIIKSKKREDFEKLKDQFINGFVRRWTKRK